MAAATKTKVSGASQVRISKNFDIYMLSSERNTEITFSNEELTKVVNDAVDVYKEIYVNEFKAIDLNSLKQTINLNLSKQESISDNVIIIENDEKGL